MFRASTCPLPPAPHHFRAELRAQLSTQREGSCGLPWDHGRKGMSRKKAQTEDSEAFSLILTFIATVAASFWCSSFYRALRPKIR